jgi:hypothetical protein
MKHMGEAREEFMRTEPSRGRVRNDILGGVVRMIERDQHSKKETGTYLGAALLWYACTARSRAALAPCNGPRRAEARLRSILPRTTTWLEVPVVAQRSRGHHPMTKPPFNNSIPEGVRLRGAKRKQ